MSMTTAQSRNMAHLGRRFTDAVVWDPQIPDLAQQRGARVVSSAVGMAVSVGSAAHGPATQLWGAATVADAALDVSAALRRSEGIKVRLPQGTRTGTTARSLRISTTHSPLQRLSRYFS